jgi:hypothetical protein
MEIWLLWLTAIGTIASPIAALGIAVWGALSSRKQARENERKLLEAQYDLERPILVVEGELLLTDSGRLDIDTHGPKQRFLTLRNVGRGIATNIQGVIFGSAPDAPYIPAYVQAANYHKFTFQLDRPLVPGERTEPLEYTPGGFDAPGDTIIDGYMLWAPAHNEIVRQGLPSRAARVTITYHDLFGRKHASHFDYTDQRKWVSHPVSKGIADDLADLRQRSHPAFPPAQEPLKIGDSES